MATTNDTTRQPMVKKARSFPGSMGMTWLLRGIGVLAALIALVVVLFGFVGLPLAASTPVVGTPIATSTGGAQVVRVQATEMQFAPNAIVVRAGQPVQLTLENRGQRYHDFTLADGVAQPAKIGEQPGQSGTLTLTFEHPGTYTFVCSQAFHAAQGMKGTIVVQ